MNTQKDETFVNLPTYFTTEYKVYDEKYASGFYAVDLDAAELFCTVRGLGEVIVGSCKKPFITITPQDLHAICFMSFIALKSGKYAIDDILSDRGILHEAIHIMDGSYDDRTLGSFDVKLAGLIRDTNSTSLVTTLFGVLNSVLPR